MNNLKYRDAERVLKKNGYHLIRTKGSHFRFTNGKNFITITRDCNGAVWAGIKKQNNLKE